MFAPKTSPPSASITVRKGGTAVDRLRRGRGPVYRPASGRTGRSAPMSNNLENDILGGRGSSIAPHPRATAGCGWAEGAAPRTHVTLWLPRASEVAGRWAERQASSPNSIRQTEIPYQMFHYRRKLMSANRSTMGDLAPIRSYNVLHRWVGTRSATETRRSPASPQWTAENIACAANQRMGFAYDGR